MNIDSLRYNKVKKEYLSFLKSQEVLSEPFRDKNGQFKNFYFPLGKSIYKKFLKNRKTKIIGLTGGQGSGKSTIAQILKIILKEGFKPDCFIVEYNGKFPPPIIYNMPYEENYVWRGGDEQGCSLQFYVNFFNKFDYNLVCCNITGTNAFFVHNKHKDKFKDIPKDIKDIFYPPDYNWFTQIGHSTSTKTIEHFAKTDD